MRKEKKPTLLSGVFICVFCTVFSISCTAQSSPQGQQREERREPPKFSELLEKMDEDDDGKLSKDEIKGPLKNDFDKVDTNKDGFISEEEFKKAPKPKRGAQPRG